MCSFPTEWQSEAACQSVDPAVFFPEADSEQEQADAVAKAKAICATCPVRYDCLDYALAARIEDGIWGGADEGERRRIRRQRRLGNAVAQQRKVETSRLVGMGASVGDVASRLGISVRQARRLHDEASSPDRQLVAAS